MVGLLSKLTFQMIPLREGILSILDIKIGDASAGIQHNHSTSKVSANCVLKVDLGAAVESALRASKVFNDYCCDSLPLQVLDVQVPPYCSNSNIFIVLCASTFNTEINKRDSHLPVGVNYIIGIVRTDEMHTGRLKVHRDEFRIVTRPVISDSAASIEINSMNTSNRNGITVMNAKLRIGGDISKSKNSSGYHSVIDFLMNESEYTIIFDDGVAAIIGKGLVSLPLPKRLLNSVDDFPHPIDAVSQSSILYTGPGTKERNSR